MSGGQSLFLFLKSKNILHDSSSSSSDDPIFLGIAGYLKVEIIIQTSYYQGEYIILIDKSLKLIKYAARFSGYFVIFFLYST